MHPLEPKRLVLDEGLMGAGRFIFNVLRNPDIKKRVPVMRNIFKKYKSHLKSACKIMKKMSLKNEFRQIECAVKPLMPQHIAVTVHGVQLSGFRERLYIISKTCN